MPHEFHPHHPLDNIDELRSKETDFRRAMMTLFRRINTKLGKDAPHLSVDMEDFWNYSNLNTTYTISMMDDKTRQTWEDYYSLRTADKKGLSAFRDVINEIIDDETVDSSVREMLDSIADNLTPQALLLTVSNFQNNFIWQPRQWGISILSTGSILYALTKDAPLPALKPAQGKTPRLKAHDQIMESVKQTVIARSKKLSSDEPTKIEEKKEPLISKPTKTKEKEAPLKAMKYPGEEGFDDPYAYYGKTTELKGVFHNPRSALSFCGWIPVKVSENGSLTLKECREYASEFDRLRQRLLGTKRTLSFLQGNSSSFDNMVSSLDRLCKLSEKYTEPEQFHSAEFHKALAAVVSYTYQYQSSHRDPDSYKDNVSRQTRLKTCAALQLCTDLFLQDADLNSMESIEARLKLKYYLAESLHGNHRASRAARADQLSECIANGKIDLYPGEIPAGEQPNWKRTFTIALKTPSDKFWAAVQSGRETRKRHAAENTAVKNVPSEKGGTTQDKKKNQKSALTKP